jgi:hypothetical protein
MKKGIGLYFIFFLLMLHVATHAQSIKDLDFLIGTWQVKETILPNTKKAYQEVGTRTCSYYLNDSFIKCEAETSELRNGNSRKRKYVYLINYDKDGNCFWATSLASDFPLHTKQKWLLDKEKKSVNTITQDTNRDRFFRSTFSLETPNKMVWNGWRSKFAGSKEWQHIFHDIAVRVK